MARTFLQKIAVIGTINRDTIVRPDSTRVHGFGGILYNIAVLAGIAGDRARIFPIVNVGRDHAVAIRRMLSTFKCVDQSAVRTVAARNNHCFLKYQSASDKTERLSGWVGSVSRRQLGFATDAEYVLVNFISGSDITTSNLYWLRSHTEATIYIDFHSRTLGRRADGRRFLRRPHDWRETIRCADVLQMNEVEFQLLMQESPELENCRQFMGTEMSEAAQGLLVTLGRRGCIVCQRRGSRIAGCFVAARKPRRVVDTTGCGDVFAAAFLSARLEGKGIDYSARFATDIASFRVGCEHPSAEAFGRAAVRFAESHVAK